MHLGLNIKDCVGMWVWVGVHKLSVCGCVCRYVSACMCAFVFLRWKCVDKDDWCLEGVAAQVKCQVVYPYLTHAHAHAQKHTHTHIHTHIHTLTRMHRLIRSSCARSCPT